MYSFSELKKDLKKDLSGFKKNRIAILGDSATQFLVQAIKGFGCTIGYDADVYEADYGQIEIAVFDEGSELYKFQPAYIILFYSTQELLKHFHSSTEEARLLYANNHIEKLSSLINAIKIQTNARVICYNLNEIDDGVWGNYANKTPASFLYQCRSINLGLMQLAQKEESFFICDINNIQQRLGSSFLHTPSLYATSELVFSLDVLPYIAKETWQIIDTIEGNFKKCLVLDLDNTIWGGVIGDDGVEHIELGALGIGKIYSAIQSWCKALKERGIILAVCSKNTEAIAKEPFASHPDMILREEDIAVFAINWETKVDNILHIRSVLNIGFDSMVFLDDNPFERNIVKQNIPGITVPELPEDPAEWLPYLYHLGLFETASYTGADKQRTAQYQSTAERVKLQTSFQGESDYLEQLEMRSVISSFNNFNAPRVAQLTQRSNQFNLRTVRYTEQDIKSLSGDPGSHTFSFTLEDKFGDNGLICVVILKENNRDLFIDTWLMSCRVLKRGMEQFVLNHLVAYGLQKGFTTLTGEYIATAKNELVKDHYKDLGFNPKGELWQLDLDSYKPINCFIKPFL